MKSMMKFLGLALMLTVVFTACSKKDNPADNNLFIGTYKGNTSYANGDQTISHSDGSVLVSKVGDRYDFKFSDNAIPAITNIQIDKGNEGYVGTVNGYTGFIKFNEKNLNIAVVKTASGETWTVNANR